MKLKFMSIVIAMVMLFSVAGMIPVYATDIFENEMITISNIVKKSEKTKVNNGTEIIEFDTYICMAPCEVKAVTELEKFEVLEMETNRDGISFIKNADKAYLAGTETENAQNESKIPEETKFTVADSTCLFYVSASNGVDNFDAVIKIEGVQPINLSNGKHTETVQLWGAPIENGTATINGVYDISYTKYGDPIYVIDSESAVTFNSYLRKMSVYDEDNTDGYEDIIKKVCTLTGFETISYMDNIYWRDTESEMENVEQIVAGATLKFNKPGNFGIYVGLGYSTRTERIKIQLDKNTDYSWQKDSTVIVKVIDTKSEANYTVSKVLVNGVEVKFEAYNINDNNYFKLRDIAKVISGSEKQFEVTWDGQKNAINLESGKPYTEVGGELKQGDGTKKTATLCTSTIYKDAIAVSLGAYTINDNNYFKLRDLGKTFDFDVSWDGENNCVLINTTSSYTDD